jgi:hypothetical protein
MEKIENLDPSIDEHGEEVIETNCTFSEYTEKVLQILGQSMDIPTDELKADWGKRLIFVPMTKPRHRIRFMWTCSDYIHHEHRWRWSAWLCGRLQYVSSRIWKR